MDNDKKHNAKQGWVYILTNPSFRDDWVKIGKSSRPVDVRLKELDNTAVPLPFEVYATLKTSKYDVIERKIHKTIDRLTDLRIRQSREFFNIKPEIALDILKDEATVLDDAEIFVNAENKAYQQNHGQGENKEDKNKRENFRFSMVNIPIGATIVFNPTGIEVKVASDNQIEYQGRIYKLSAFVGTFLPADRRNPSGAYQGPKFFSYNGHTLTELREELEEGDTK